MKIYVVSFIMLCVALTINSQEAIPSSGGEGKGISGTVSYSVGQLVYTTNSSSNGKLKQGVQQGIELFALNNIDLTAINLTAITYPNPTTNKVILALKDSDLTNLSYTLYDLNRKDLISGVVNHAHTPIPMETFQSGVYILKVNQNNKELKSFKIIKN
jgi:hypothetical protein